MQTTEISNLIAQFAIREHVSFVAGAGGLPVAEISNGYATATILLHGGQVLAYVGTTATCAVEDAVLRRRLSIAKAGSRSTVVWNPWGAKSQRMQDFDDKEYRTMVCVETTNAADDQVTVPAGETAGFKRSSASSASAVGHSSAAATLDFWSLDGSVAPCSVLD